MSKTNVTNLLDSDLARLGAATRMYWSRPGLTLVGLGGVNAVEFTDIDNFAEISKNCFVEDADHIAFTAAPFDRNASGWILIPNVVIKRTEEQGEPVIEVMGDLEILEAVLDAQAKMSAPVSETSSITSFEPDLDPQVWKGIVGNAIETFKTETLNKVVLARSLVAQISNLDIQKVLKVLSSKTPLSYTFAIDSLVGSSPELLISKFGDKVAAHPLAGTITAGDDPEKNGNDLIGSTKDQWEHRVTIEWFLDSLLDYCSFVDAEPEPTLVRAGNLLHLGTKVLGQSRDVYSVADLVAALHPTPAVGGSPQQEAIEYIAKHEQLDRRSYAGPVGWFDGKGDGEFAVGIRSAHIDEVQNSSDEPRHKVTVYAGVGVVEGSDPELELAETEAKLRLIIEALTAQIVN